MAGKYLDLEIEYLRQDLECEFKYLREDLEFIREDIAQIQDLVGIERKDYLTEEDIERPKNSDDDKLLVKELEEQLKIVKEQNKPH